MKNQPVIEIEIKSLLGSKEKAQALLKNLYKRDKNTSKVHKSQQLNHYFLPGNFDLLLKNIRQHLSEEETAKLTHIIKKGKSHSTRTRRKNEEVILVVKATIDDTPSANGTARLEYEVSLADFTIDQVDQILLRSEFNYEAKWSREREEYKYKDYVVSIDRNAGYGYLAEFEKVVPFGEDVEKVKKRIRQEMKSLDIEELPQDRLARMFAFYNKNWREYYGTEKTFKVF